MTLRPCRRPCRPVPSRRRAVAEARAATVVRRRRPGCRVAGRIL